MISATPTPLEIDPATACAPQRDRLLSLDALRGFDMFWIIGGSGLVKALAEFTHWRWADWLGGQMQHPVWNGFALYDLIFPLFLFISGVTIPYSLLRRIEAGEPKRRLYLRVLRRVVLLVFLGMVCNGFLKFDFAGTRYPSVLGRIGLAYGLAAVVAMNSRRGTLLLWIVGILLGYWAMLMWIPVPGVGRGVLTQEGWLGGYIDHAILPGKLYRRVHDPEGLLSTLPAVATALLGVVTGLWLRSPGGVFIADRKAGPDAPRRLSVMGSGILKAVAMCCAGIVLRDLGSLWDPWFPINKNMWSSSFVLHAGGWSLILLSVFYLVIDVIGLRRWAFPFVIIGLNPITIYVLGGRLIDFQKAAHFLFDGALSRLNEGVRPVFWWLAVLLVEWLFLYFLYRKKVFLRV